MKEAEIEGEKNQNWRSQKKSKWKKNKNKKRKKKGTSYLENPWICSLFNPKKKNFFLCVFTTLEAQAIVCLFEQSEVHQEESGFWRKLLHGQCRQSSVHFWEDHQLQYSYPSVSFPSFVCGLCVCMVLVFSDDHTMWRCWRCWRCEQWGRRIRI